MEEEMADEAGQEDGPAPPDEEVAACLTKTQFAACAKQWTRQAPRPLDPATDEVTFQQSEVCRRRCPRPTFTTAALTTSTVTTASVATTTLTATLTATLNQHHPNHHHPNRHGPQRLDPRHHLLRHLHRCPPRPSPLPPPLTATPRVPQVDYTIDSVIPELTGTFTQEARAAVIRMFGITKEGNSVMVHVHGFFPYLYVRAPTGFTPAHCEAFKQTLAQRLKGQSQKEPLVNPVRTAAPCTRPATPRAQPATPPAPGAQCGFGPEAVDHALPVRQRGRLPEDRRGLAADGGHVPSAARAGSACHGRRAAQLRDLREQLGLRAALHGRPRDHRLQLGDAQGGLLAAAAVDDRVGHASRQEEPLRILSFDIECAGRPGIFPEAAQPADRAVLAGPQLPGLAWPPDG